MKLVFSAALVLVSISSFAGTVKCSGKMGEYISYPNPSPISFSVEVESTNNSEEKILVKTENFKAILVQEMQNKFIAIQSRNNNVFAGSISLNDVGVTTIKGMRGVGEENPTPAPYLHDLTCVVTK